MFRLVRRGYDPDEVLCFIESMAESLETYAESQYKMLAALNARASADTRQAGEDKAWIEQLTKMTQELTLEVAALRAQQAQGRTGGA